MPCGNAEAGAACLAAIALSAVWRWAGYRRPNARTASSASSPAGWRDRLVVFETAHLGINVAATGGMGRAYSWKARRIHDWILARVSGAVT